MEEDQSTTLPPFNLDDFSKKAEEFYNEIKGGIEVQFKGKYAAIDFQSKKYWIGETASEALSSAKKEFSSRLFYVVQIGSPATYTIQSMMGSSGVLQGCYDSQW